MFTCSCEERIETNIENRTSRIFLLWNLVRYTRKHCISRGVLCAGRAGGGIGGGHRRARHEIEQLDLAFSRNIREQIQWMLSERREKEGRKGSNINSRGNCGIGQFFIAVAKELPLFDHVRHFRGHHTFP